MMNNAIRPENQYVLLDKQYVDVTGDHIPDQVSLLGQKFSPDTVYYRQIFVEVVDRAAHKPSIITLQGGYNPKMLFCDFNGDRVADILVSAETGGSGGTSDYYIFTDINNIPEQLSVPHPVLLGATVKKSP